MPRSIWLPRILFGTASNAGTSLTFAAAIFVLFAPNCGAENSPDGPVANSNPVPSIVSISPASTYIRAAATTVTVTGSDYVADSTVRWNGTSLSTKYVSGSKLTAVVPASDLISVGAAEMTVSNPSPGGGVSSAKSFIIKNPLPTISALVPYSTHAGARDFSLTILGTNFLPSTTALWNGSARPTTYVSGTKLTVAISAADAAKPGTGRVTVQNAAPGGGSPQASMIIFRAIPANAFYVSPSGRDTNPGTFAAPFATVQHCASTAASGRTCVLRSGVYRETVKPNSGITITAYDGEQAVIDGADPVTGWTLHQGSVYVAPASLSSATEDDNQVFVGGKMMTEARWPNGGDLFHINYATAGEGSSETRIVDSNIPAGDWVGASVYILSGTDPYDPITGQVTSASSGILNLTLDGSDNPPWIELAPAGKYYLFGRLSLLNAANEWYYDSNAGKLYLWAPGGVDPNTLFVTAKLRKWGIDLSGRSNVAIEGIQLFATSINMDSSSTGNVIDGIIAQYVSHYARLQDNFNNGWGSYNYAHMADSGIVLNGTGNVLRNSTVLWSAGNGAVLVGSGNSVTNNLIRYSDYAGIQLSGITILGPNNTVQHNTIYDDGRYGITFSSAVNPVGKVPNYVDVSYNNIYDSSVLGWDSGEIYAGSLSLTGVRIHHNWTHNTQFLYSGKGAVMTGVYIDAGTSGVEVDQNVIWNNAAYNIFVNGYSFQGGPTPNNNNIHNNTIPDSGHDANIYLHSVTDCGTTRVIDNLVLVPVQSDASACTQSNNDSTAPGADEMTASVTVGCNLAGCSTSRPPSISGSAVSASIASDPYDITVSAGQSATFKVIAAGSPTLSYQWFRNGVPIPGAIASAYTRSAVKTSDNGTTFTVLVGNAHGSALSAPATLSVQ